MIGRRGRQSVLACFRVSKLFKDKEFIKYWEEVVIMKKIRFKYFQADDVDRHSFYRIPKQLFTLEEFKNFLLMRRFCMRLC